jgi:hypothetical protein
MTQCRRLNVGQPYVASSFLEFSLPRLNAGQPYVASSFLEFSLPGIHISKSFDIYSIYGFLEDILFRGLWTGHPHLSMELSVGIFNLVG